MRIKSDLAMVSSEETKIWLGAGHIPVAGLVPVAGRECCKMESVRTFPQTSSWHRTYEQQIGRVRDLRASEAPVWAFMPHWREI